MTYGCVQPSKLGCLKMGYTPPIWTGDHHCSRFNGHFGVLYTHFLGVLK